MIAKHPQGKDILFVIERNLDEDIVVYTAKLNADRTELIGVDMFWTKHSNWAHNEPVSESTKRVFYGVVFKKIDDRKDVKHNLYRMSVNCMRETCFIDIHVRKGKVCAKSVFGKRECTLKKIFVELSAMPPDLKGLWIHGTFNGNPESCEIKVNRSLIDSIDISDFMPGLGL